jgi:hypothetical protein
LPSKGVTEKVDCVQTNTTEARVRTIRTFKKH